MYDSCLINPCPSTSSVFYLGQNSARSAPRREDKINCHSVWSWDCVVASLLAMTDRVESQMLNPGEVNRQILSVKSILVSSAGIGARFTNQYLLATITSWKLMLHFKASVFHPQALVASLQISAFSPQLQAGSLCYSLIRVLFQVKLCALSASARE